MKRKYILIFLLSFVLVGCQVEINPTRCEINVKQGSSDLLSGSGFFDFGSIPLGSLQKITFTIENTGIHELKLTSYPIIKVSGIDANDFSASSNLTKTNITAGSSTTFAVSFSPKSIGNKSAKVVIPNNDRDESQYTFTVSGVCTQPAPEMHVRQDSTDIMHNSGTYDFGSIIVNQTSPEVVFTIENNGNEKLLLTGSSLVSVFGDDGMMFIVDHTNTLSEITPGSSTTFAIRFKPISAGDKTAKIRIANNDSDENPYIFNLIGKGDAIPEINVKQGSTNIQKGSWIYDFGDVIINESSPEVEFTIENIGSADLELTGSNDFIEIKGADPMAFLIDQTDVKTLIAPGSSVVFKVSFVPTSTGSKKAQISIPNNDTNNDPFTFNIEGTCVEPEIDIVQGTTSIPNSTGGYDFGLMYYGFSSVETTFRIDNLGTGDLFLTGSTKIEVLGTDSAMFIVNDSATVSPITKGSSTTFTLTFTPTSAGNKTATISIANSDLDENPYTFTLTGECQTQQPEMNIEVDSVDIPCTTGKYDFGSVANGFSTPEKYFKIENKGVENLYLTGSSKIEIFGTDSGMFRINQNITSSTIEPGRNTYFKVYFRPTSIGNKSATISISNNDTDENPYTFTVLGVCTNPEPEMDLRKEGVFIPHQSTFSLGHIDIVRTYVDVYLTISNAKGTDDLELTGTPKIQLSGADASMFSINESITTSPISHGSSTNFAIRFSPTSVGTKYARITIPNNDSDENPYIVDITATSSMFGRGDALGWIGGGSDGWKTTDGAGRRHDYQSFYTPNGMCLDSSGNIYVADVYNYRITKWDSNGNAIGWIGGGSNGWKTAIAPTTGGTDYKSFDEPHDVFVDSAGYIYVTDKDNFRVCKWDSAGNAIGWIGGGSNGWKTSTAPTSGGDDFRSMKNSQFLFVDSAGNIYVSDNSQHWVSKWSSNGTALGWIGGGSNGWKTANGSYYNHGEDYQSFSQPADMFVDSAGFIFVVDTGNNRVCKWSSNGTALGWFGDASDGWKTTDSTSFGKSDFRSFNYPVGITVDSAGHVFVTDKWNDRVCLWDKDANAMGWIGDGKTGWQITVGANDDNDYKSFDRPTSVTLDSSGNIYVVDVENSRISKWRN